MSSLEGGRSRGKAKAPARPLTPAGEATPLDLSGNTRIPLIMDMVERLSRASTPHDVLRIFAGGLNQIESQRGYLSLSTRHLQSGQYRITRMLRSLGEQLRQPPDEDHWNRLPTLPVRSGGLLGRIVQNGQAVIYHDIDLSEDPVLSEWFSSYRSVMAIPLFDNGQALNWAVFFRRHRRGFSARDMDQAILRANLVGGTVRHVLLTQQLREAHTRIREEVDRIAAIQQALLPSPLPKVPGLSLAADYHIYDQAGGDLYDVVRLPQVEAQSEPCWAIMISDASGHGPAATVVSAMMHALLNAYPRSAEGPAEVLRHANVHLCAKRIDSSFVTVFLGFFNPSTRVLTYSSAGHPPPLLKDPGPGGKVQRLSEGGGLPLGIIPDAEYETASVQLHRKQTLLLYSDGITEARNERGEMFNVEGIEAAMASCVGDPACTISTLRNALRRHEGGVRPSDDQTLLAVQLT